MSIYTITERLIVDDEVAFEIDIDRAVKLINEHRGVACGTFEEAEKILAKLGFTDASISTLFAKAVGMNDMEEEPDALELPG